VPPEGRRHRVPLPHAARGRHPREQRRPVAREHGADVLLLLLHLRSPSVRSARRLLRVPLRRHAQGLRQVDLAERVGVSELTVRNWEAGKGPQARRLPTIARALEVDALTLRDELDQWAAARGGLFEVRPRRRRVDRARSGPSG
jgi:DNA-binding XRE family transcriptional regulator